MRRLRPLWLVLTASVLLGACAAAPITDPYEIVHRSASATWDQVQVELGLAVKSSTTNFTLPPEALRLDLDTSGGRALVHLAVPSSVFPADSQSGLASFLGPDGKLDLDLLYDSQALYGKSPLFKALAALLAGSGGTAPSGDQTGWLHLISKADLESLASKYATALAPKTSPDLASPAPSPSAVDTAALKADLNNAGITLTFVDTAQHQNTTEDHLTMAFDTAKLLASPKLGSAAGQVESLRSALEGVTISADLWTDHASYRLGELDLHVSKPGTDGGSIDLTVLLTTPDPSTSYAAPADAGDFPLIDFLTSLGQFLDSSVMNSFENSLNTNYGLDNSMP
jgi:hypothetical protein